MLNRREFFAGAAGLGAVLLAPLEAFAANWVNLGSRAVNLLYDHDTIHVGAAAGFYTHIRLHVTGNTVFIDTLRIVFSDGSSENVALRFMFLPGTYSRDINLPGAARHIRRVEMTYNKLLGGGTAKVTLEGRKV